MTALRISSFFILHPVGQQGGWGAGLPRLCALAQICSQFKSHAELK
jgi:hypothetical protein